MDSQSDIRFASDFFDLVSSVASTVFQPVLEMSYLGAFIVLVIAVTVGFFVWSIVRKGL